MNLETERLIIRAFREAEFKESFWDEINNSWRDEYLYAMLKKDWERNLK